MRHLWFSFVVLLLLGGCSSTPPVPVQTAKPDPTPAPAVSEAVTPVADPDEFPVAAEKKRESLAQIKDLVAKLNDIIARKAFSEWKLYLDTAYIQTYGDPLLLKNYSDNSPFLKQFKVRLKSLEDYFKFVVVPSRADVNVADISFVDETRVKVWTIVDNDRVLLYLLKLYGTEWKISSW